MWGVDFKVIHFNFKVMDSELKQQILKREYELRVESSEDALEKQRKNSGFFMLFDGKSSSVLRGLIAESSVAARIFIWLAENMDRLGAILVANKTLSEVLEIPHATQVSKGLKILREKGMVFTLKTGGGNLHGISPEYAWRSTETSKPNAFFYTRVCIDSQELENAIQGARLNYAKAVEMEDEKMKLRTVKAKVMAPKKQREFQPPVGEEAIDGKAEIIT